MKGADKDTSGGLREGNEEMTDAFIGKVLS